MYQHFTGCPCLSALCSKLRWYTTVSMADHHVLLRHLFTDRLRSLSFSASDCWQWWHDCTTYLDRALWSAQFLRRGTPHLEHCHLISRTVMLVAKGSSRALRLGSLCKLTHERCLWELCLTGALQILDLIDWLNNSKYTGRAKKSNPLGKILYLWSCSRFFHQIYSVYRWGFTPHILQILLK